MPHFSGGSHIVVEMDDHGTRRLNPYSLMSDPSDGSGYEISVRRDEAGLLRVWEGDRAIVRYYAHSIAHLDGAPLWPDEASAVAVARAAIEAEWEADRDAIY